MATPASTPRAGHERAWIVATLMLGTMSTLLSATIVNVAFPALIAEMHVGHDTVQWVATGFLAATTATMLATAWALATFGERTTYIATLAVFGVGSLVGALAWDIDSLVFARVMQGAAAGLLQPLAMVVLFRVFPLNERGRAMGIYGFGIVLAPAIGPALGGALVTAFGWRWIFALSLPFCVAGIALARRTLVDHRSAERPPFDAPGFVLLALGLVAALNVPVVGRQSGWTSAPLLALAAAALLLWAGFMRHELRTRAPLLSFRLFRHRTFSASAVVAVAYGAGLFGTTYLIPVFVQDVAHYTAAGAGGLMVVPGLALAVSMALGGRITDRTEPRFVMIAGLALFAASAVLFAFTGAATAAWTFVAWLVIGRVGLGLLIPALNVGAVQALAGGELAQGAAGVNFLRQLGGAAGVNLLAVYLQFRLNGLDAAQAPRAFHECFILVAAAFAVAIAAAWSARTTGR
ncbi:MAG TPA: DHA2 family efflux MFS transporter permease subunit [Casimicrobiaceae bacterium]|jgi:EmrB/QacA subfamily drug resistance transporter|nr:DHA2 family efflux MFS transporter permease subunit [Casimicrobiaceae bacterium]